MSAPPYVVARVFSDPGTYTEANARLIAAAPDLLAACIDLVKWEERAADRECRASIGEAIRAAIAKAVGK